MKKVYLYIGLAALLFGTMEVALKLAGNNLDPLQLTFVRFAIGGLIILPIGLLEKKKNKIQISGRDLTWLLLLGIVCIPICMVFFQLGVIYTSASTAAVLFCINPLSTMVLAHFFSGETMNRNKLVAFFIGLIGILFMMRPWDIQEGNTWKGMSFSLIAAVFFSIYTIMGKRTIGRLGNVLQTGISFLFGAAVLLVIILVTGKPVLMGLSHSIPLIAYVSIFVTGMGYWAFFQAIKYSDATTGSVAFFIKPAIAPLFAVLILGENLLWNTIIGILFILGASYINLHENKKGRVNNGTVNLRSN